MAAFDTSTLLAVGVIGIVILVVLFLIGVLYNSLILWIVSKLFKLHNTKFKTAILAALVAGVVNFIISILLSVLNGAIESKSTAVSAGGLKLLLSWGAMFIVNSLAAKKFYKLETRKSFLVGLMWTIAAIVVGLLVGIILGIILLAVLLGAGGLRGVA